MRLLFCLFADDTGIFEKDSFVQYIEQRTANDGSDLAMHLSKIFEVLNKEADGRLKNLDEDLQDLPYVNGKLFEERLPIAAFDSSMRRLLIDCCYLDWGQISPAIFGSLFQSVMDPEERRNLGAHYTSEKNIQKLIGPLFLDELKEEFQKLRGPKQMQAFHKKLSELRFLDPACGCGNFLVITYRELRLLELELLRKMHKSGQGFLDVSEIIWLDVDQFYGIEIDEWPARIAEVALWLMDHQMNLLISEEFGQYFARLPLKKSAKIVHANALRLDWKEVIAPKDLSYILGNPPFLGKHYQNKEQKEDLKSVFEGIKGAGVLDLVAAWYVKAAQYIQDTKIKVAFVSTNSITQGEQVATLWNVLLNEYGIQIHFAHRTFQWNNEARGKAAVHVVIIGFATIKAKDHIIFDYSHIKGESTELQVNHINPYLVEADDLIIKRRSQPICKVPKMIWGNKPVDGGNLILTPEEYQEQISIEPESKAFLKRYIGGQELIQNKERWCLWLVDTSPQAIKSMPRVLDRIRKVKEMREQSIDPGAQKLAGRPTQFRDTLNPNKFIAIPEVSSHNRTYIPIAFLDGTSIASNKIQMIPNAGLFEFGILTSIMHMAWVQYVCGRLKSDYSYSNTIVYNNFPWPEPSPAQKETVERCAQQVLDTREKYPDSSLADLYDPLTRPPDLLKAHHALDKAVDKCYRKEAFKSEMERIGYLFERYRGLVEETENK